MTKQEIYKRLKKLGKQDKKIKAIVVFGSFVKGKKYNDIDVLIVREKTPMKPILYGKAVIKLRNKLDDIPFLDMRVVTPQIFEGNLNNHNPFYLDIVFDGKIVYGNKYAKPNFKKVKEYVENKGIKRDSDLGGWSFPVKYREATFMSEATNKDRAEVWIKEAMADYENAKLTAVKIPSRCITHCQQTIEKAIKGVLACSGEFKRTHEIGKVLLKVKFGKKLPGSRDKKLRELALNSQETENEFAKTCYPNVYYDDKKNFWVPTEEYTKEDAAYFLKLATRSLKIARDFINWWFKE